MTKNVSCMLFKSLTVILAPTYTLNTAQWFEPITSRPPSRAEEQREKTPTPTTPAQETPQQAVAKEGQTQSGKCAAKTPEPTSDSQHQSLSGGDQQEGQQKEKSGEQEEQPKEGVGAEPHKELPQQSESSAGQPAQQQPPEQPEQQQKEGAQQNHPPVEVRLEAPQSEQGRKSPSTSSTHSATPADPATGAASATGGGAEPAASVDGGGSEGDERPPPPADVEFPFAIHHLTLCPDSNTLCVSSQSSQVLVCRLSMAEAEVKVPVSIIQKLAISFSYFFLRCVSVPLDPPPPLSLSKPTCGLFALYSYNFLSE